MQTHVVLPDPKALGFTAIGKSLVNGSDRLYGQTNQAVRHFVDGSGSEADFRALPVMTDTALPLHIIENGDTFHIGRPG